MVTKSSLNPDEQNQDAYDDLIVSIEAGEGKLSLLIAVCDNGTFRDEIIAKYETELQPHFRHYRTTLTRGEPSLNAAINNLVEQEEYLRNSQPAVITVTGVQKLFFLKLGEEQSEQEKFFGYLQWTREALREYPFAIVLWVTNQLLVNLIKKAPDFWSWRSGVFHFVSKAKNFVDVRELEPIRLTFQGTELDDFDDDKSYSLSVEDLQRLIGLIERESGKEDKKLATLYVELADIYRRRLDRGEAGDYRKEQSLAVKYYSKAIELQQQLGLEEALAHSLNNLAALYDSQGRYEQAEPLYIQALEIYKRILGENHPDTASSLNNLALLYDSQGRYEQAEPLYIQALELTKRINGENHPDYARSLNNLALLYRSQGRYDEAEPLYIQALELYKQLLGVNHPFTATSLNNLALLYNSQGKYEQAEPLFIQALELRKRILGENHPSTASSLNCLAFLYRSQGRYEQAEPLFIQALELRKRILGENHPYTATSMNNLAALYNSQGRYDEAEPLYIQALELRKRILGENHPDYAQSLNNLALLYRSQGRYEQAEPLYIQALEIYKRILGENHPYTATSMNNLAFLYDSQRRYDQAEPLYIQALEIYKRILGENHPDTKTTRENLEIMQRERKQKKPWWKKLFGKR